MNNRFPTDVQNQINNYLPKKGIEELKEKNKIHERKVKEKLSEMFEKRYPEIVEEALKNGVKSADIFVINFEYSRTLQISRFFGYNKHFYNVSEVAPSFNKNKIEELLQEINQEKGYNLKINSLTEWRNPFTKFICEWN